MPLPSVAIEQRWRARTVDQPGEAAQRFRPGRLVAGIEE
jgi:hypothetical protein